MNIAERLMASARIVPIQQQNQVKEVCKLEGGSLRVTLNSGEVFTLGPDDEQFQAFVVWSVLNKGF
jgi:hypothetical protein